MSDPIIIVGTGLAGYNLAREIRKLDTSIPLTLLTRDDGAFYSKPMVTTVLALIVAIVILRILLQELTIVQVFAAMTFMMALMMVQFASYGKEIIEIINNPLVLPVRYSSHRLRSMAIRIE